MERLVQEILEKGLIENVGERWVCYTVLSCSLINLGLLTYLVMSPST